MGKIEVRGIAERTVDYDLMKILIDFHAREETPDEASQKVLKECEDFLTQLKNGGFDLSAMALKSDDVKRGYYYSNNDEKEYYNARRELELVCKFNMKLINDLRSIANSMKSKIGFEVSYMLSKENVIMHELLMEALKDAKNQAEMLASAIDQKVKGLVSADKKEPKAEVAYGGEILCMDSFYSEIVCEHPDFMNSDELVATTTTLREHIFTVWEIE